MNIYRILNKIKTKIPESERDLEDQEMTDQMKTMAERLQKQKRRQAFLRRQRRLLCWRLWEEELPWQLPEAPEILIPKLLASTLIGKGTETDAEIAAEVTK